ncbi:hypothetical protein AVEN_210851-1 [Araneus ventricosus]|uniref:Uncharacterized protein n=1 Tax=Araneus ventricosus TaxID=182803 RepID=A0A4Y2MUS8_ARAVE|nr:hypothetical protein AVEN_210851-1 [Araneus ventricosus]
MKVDLIELQKKIQQERNDNEEFTKLVLTHRIDNKIKEYIRYLVQHGVNERKIMNVDDDEQHEEAYVNAQDLSNVLEMESHCVLIVKYKEWEDYYYRFLRREGLSIFSVLNAG